MHASTLKTATEDSSETCSSVDFVFMRLTQFYSPPTEPESGKHHLSQTEDRTEGREEADRQYSDNVEEDNDTNTICETDVEEGQSKDTNGEGGDDHVGGEPLHSL